MKQQILSATASFVLVGVLVGCSAISPSLSDERVLRETSLALGTTPENLIIKSRATEGQSTYINLATKDGRTFTCVISGGGILTAGITNPPMCGRPGESVNHPLLGRVDLPGQPSTPPVGSTGSAMPPVSPGSPAAAATTAASQRADSVAPAAPQVAANANSSGGAVPAKASPAAPATQAELVKEIQTLLKAKGHYTGKADGSMGPQTRNAVIAYQKKVGLAADGTATLDLLAHLRKN